jgi:hypothetical protein
MKKMLMLLASLLAATTAFAAVDSDPNSIGLYFDMNADNLCATGVAPYSNVPAYLLLTNPTFDNLYGFEVAYSFEGNAIVLSTTFANAQALNVGTADNMIVGFGAPTETAPVTLLATLDILYTDTTMGAVNFNMTASTPSSNQLGLPTLLLDAGFLAPGGFSTLNGEFAAIINGMCEDVVDTDELSFDSVKSLYR